jgi:hypothetical protein
MTVEETSHIAEPKSVNVDDHTSIESASDDGRAVVAPSGGETSGGRRFSRIFLLAILAIVVGLAVGLGLGLTIDETKKSHLRTPTKSEGEENDPTVPPVPPVEGGQDSQDPPSGTKPVVDVTVVPMEDKTQWPELMGKSCDEAKTTLEGLNGGHYEIQVVYPGDQETKDFRFNRIRLYVDESCIITEIPLIGR